jgi:hypothetical protein
MKAARTQYENDRLAYDRHRREAVGALFHSLPAGEQETSERLADRAAARFDGSLRTSMRGVYRAKIAAQRRPEAFKTLAEWKAAA